MQERKIDYWYIINVVLALLFGIGLILFGYKCWKVTEGRSTSSQIGILLLGLMIYIYTIVFTISALVIPISYRNEDNASKKTFNCLAVVIFSAAIIMEVIFWGILLSKPGAFTVAGIILLINIYPTIILIKRCTCNK